MLDKTNKFNELTLRDDIPKDGTAFELLRVVVEATTLSDRPVQCEDERRYRYHVTDPYLTLFEPEKFWGESLAEIALGIARERSAMLLHEGEDEEYADVGEMLDKIGKVFSLKLRELQSREWVLGQLTRIKTAVEENDHQRSVQLTHELWQNESGQ